MNSPQLKEESSICCLFDFGKNLLIATSPSLLKIIYPSNTQILVLDFTPSILLKSFQNITWARDGPHFRFKIKRE